uniref:Putative secreted protein n=1 Tax=Anopheles darlingi TaxID=43151 RepID=A0A2M4DK42_ANODA
MHSEEWVAKCKICSMLKWMFFFFAVAVPSFCCGQGRGTRIEMRDGLGDMCSNKKAQQRRSREWRAAYMRVYVTRWCVKCSQPLAAAVAAAGVGFAPAVPFSRPRRASPEHRHTTSTTTTTATDSVCVFPRWQCAEPPCRAPRCVRDPLYCFWLHPFLSLRALLRVCVCTSGASGMRVRGEVHRNRDDDGAPASLLSGQTMVRQ